jgi:Cof subfamily protein (haloacid dehalogenase superfamily)
MNKFKMIAIDIDGTLLNKDKKILFETKQDIKEAYNKGVIICICTGRAYPATKKYVDELGLDIPLILYNGSRIIMNNGEKIIFNKTIDKEVSNGVFDIINMNDGTCCFWKEDTLYFNKNNEYTVYYENLTGIKPTIINDYDENLFTNINKFLWFDTPENLEFIKNNILNNVVGIDCFKSQNNILEIVPKGINKGEAIKFLANYYNIDISEVIAVGDDENDISMIMAAGLGVAMENAKDCVKEAADFITLSNEENGVGKVICEFMLKLYWW